MNLQERERDLTRIGKKMYSSGFIVNEKSDETPLAGSSADADDPHEFLNFPKR